MTEMSESDEMTVTGEERPGHRVLTDVVTDLYDCSSTSTLEVAVRPKSDMDAEEPIDIVIEKDRSPSQERHGCGEPDRQRDRKRRSPSQERHRCGEVSRERARE